MEIRKQTKYDFILPKVLIKMARPVSIQVRNMDLTEVLNICFKLQPFSFKINGKVIIATERDTLSAETAVTPFQKINIRGRVINEKSEGLENANITIKGTSSTVITDSSGGFLFKDVDEGVTLVISYVGYKTVEVKAMEELGDIMLRVNPAALSEVEVVSTGYQRLPKERAAGSFERVSNEQLNTKVSTDIISRLEGNSSIYFDNRNGARKLNIRGRGTLFGNPEPLIVLDGFPYDGDINNINPNDVEDITILKDAAAASIWGVRAANGVVVITTKKGRYDKAPSLSFNANLSIVHKPDIYYNPIMSSADFIDTEQQLFSKGFYDSYLQYYKYYPQSPVVELLDKARSGNISVAEANRKIAALKGMDVRRDIEKYFLRSGVRQQYALNYSGGGNRYNYMLSGGYDRNMSTDVGNTDDRITLRADNSFKPVRQLELGLGINYVQSNTTANNPGLDALKPLGKNALYPYAQLADARGNALPVIKYYAGAYLDTAGAGRLLDWKYRPLDELRMADNHTRQQDVRININAIYKLGNSLKLEAKYQYERQATTAVNLRDIGTYEARDNINRFSLPTTNGMKYQVPLGGILDRSDNEMNAYALRAQADYQKTWDDQSTLSVIMGGEIRQMRTAASIGRTYGYNGNVLTYENVNYADYLPTFNNLAYSARIPNPADFSGLLLRNTALYANAAYTFREKYTISGSARKDASNLFGVHSNQRGVPLWSTGAGWRVDKETFYHIDWLPQLKMRASVGYNGNVDNGLSALTTIGYQTNAGMTGLPWAIILTPPNPRLRWEKIRVFNIGIDFATRNNRVSGSVEYYTKKGADLIGLSPIDPTTGVRTGNSTFSFKGNVADMKGRGMELALTTKNLKGALQWNSNLFFNYVSNEVTSYKYENPSAASYVDWGNNINPVEGRPVYSIFSYRWAGLDPATGDPIGYVNGKASKDYAAIVNTKMSDLKYSGSAVPTMYGALRNTFAFRQFSLSANIGYKLGYVFKRPSIYYSSLFNTWLSHADYHSRWQAPGDEQRTNVPSMLYPADESRDAFYNGAEILVESGSHIRLQDVIFSYQHNNTGKAAFKSLRIFINANNLGIIWKANKSGLDPDYFSGDFPVSSSYALGFNATF